MAKLKLCCNAAGRTLAGAKVKLYSGLGRIAAGVCAAGDGLAILVEDVPAPAIFHLAQ